MLLAAIPSETVAPTSLVLLALFTADAPVAVAARRALPVLGALSLAFGVWYAAATWALAPCPF